MPPAEEVLRNQGDKLTHSEDANGPLSPAAPMPAQRVHGHRDMETKMESPACSPSQGSSNTTLTSAAERSAEPQHNHTPWGTRLFPLKMGKSVSLPGTHISLDKDCSRCRHHHAPAHLWNCQVPSVPPHTVPLLARELASQRKKRGEGQWNGTWNSLVLPASVSQKQLAFWSNGVSRRPYRHSVMVPDGSQ